MRTEGDSAISDSDYEEGGPSESIVSVDSDLGARQQEQKYVVEPLTPPANKEAPDSQPHTQEDAKPTVSGAGRSRVRSAAGLVLKFVLQVLVAYLAFIATAGPVPQLLSEAPCKHPALAKHFPHCTREAVPIVTPEGPVIVPEEPVIIPEEPIVAPDFVTLVRLQSRLGQVMEDTARSSKVAVDIKDSEMSLRDLRTMVTHSSLSNKDILGRSLKRFVTDAKATGGNLQQFGSRVWGAVDRVVTLNEHTLIMLENQPTERGLSKTYQKGLEDIWLQGIGLLDKTLRKLIHEAQDNIGALQRLDERLEGVEELVYAEQEAINDRETELKRQWVKETLGFNKEKHESHSTSLELLTVVKDNRESALKHVNEALLKLKQMSNDLDDLREGVATPMMITGSSNIPIETHIKSIRSGTERLVNGQTRMRQIEDDYRREKFATD
ncbi:unnamed protein product [Rhizoctonia solani]|uniref:Uncharacterized protein n=1 Tax=Rhizoctonia solani TaxID=456999 RepID=A0A8H3HN42_9AGAM|nr:unnamed protein product [Rhizoctonia solani]